MPGSDHTIIFDLDGTLVDTAPDLCRALNHVLEKHRQPTVHEETVRAHVGKGALKLIERGMAESGDVVDGDFLKQLEKEFLIYYKANIADASRPFPGAVDALDELARQDALLGICTNKREALSRQLLDELDLLHYFPVVLGADSLDVHKPDPRHILETVERLGGRPEKAIMIGDSATDVEAARNAGVPVVVVSFGYTSQRPESLGGDRLIDHFDELGPVLGELFRA